MTRSIDDIAQEVLILAGGNHAKASRLIAKAIRKLGPGRKEITVERLKERVNYDPETGKMIWIKSFKSKIGNEVGCVGDNGYRYVRIDGFDYLVHRLAVLYMTGEMPKGVVDHKNGDTIDNRWENLRDATQSQNMANMTVSPRDLPRGIYHRPDRPHPFLAKITRDGEEHHIGYFDTVDEAMAAHIAKAVDLFGEFADRMKVA